LAKRVATSFSSSSSAVSPTLITKWGWTASEVE
jgi:hypothetical protein